MSSSDDDNRSLPAHWRFDKLTANGVGPADRPLWLSLEEKLGEPAPRPEGGEFPSGATEPPEGVARREFLGLAGAALALAGAGCYTRPAEKILPYTTQPNLLFPGTPLHYATALSLGGATTGVLVTSWEGRPTKVEGNPDHPASLGATGVFEQAWVLQLYDPDRARQVRSPKGPVAWRSFLEHLAQKLPQLAQTQGAGLRFLVEPTSSPLLASLRQQLLARYPKARFVAYDAVARDEAFEGARLAFGKPLDVLPELSRADVVVALDSDFLQPLPSTLRDALQFGERRDPEAGPMNRLYVAESAFTVTGSVADHRARVRSVDVAHVALGLLARAGGPLADAARRLARPLGMDRWLDAAAADLVKNRGRALVLVGDRQPALVHALGHALNSALGSYGATAQLVSPAVQDTRAGPASLAELAEEIRLGQVDTLVITAKNPAYAAPANVGFADLLSKVPEVVYLGLYEDETAQRSGWFLPEAHGLESWGDGRAKDGTAAIRQPLIQPLFSSVSDVELLSAFLGGLDTTAYELLREHWRAHAAGQDFETAWKTWLARGVIAGTASAQEQARFDSAAVLAELVPGHLPPADGGLEINFRPDYKVHDGRFANHPWLQELPDPITKVTWENAVLMGPSTARKLDVGSGDVVELRYRGRAVQGPALIVPGQADGSVTVALGYGRGGAESVARKVGFDAYRLRTSIAPWFDVGLEVHKTRQTHRFANTQAHWSMEGRPIALDQMLADYRAAPEAATKTLKGPVATLQEPVQYPGFRWAMSVDLSRCTGCSACVVACQAENNIPTVGREQVANGREMHWLRIDRYFVGRDLADPQLVTQPMLCQHCETAPCEYVCPVNATIHSDEGLNDMIYNRCVGTRYCGNNCPYKVRRFNFLHWTARLSPTEQMAMNPDVTVRDRGVMEKCTFCVQRIERTRIDARIHNGGKISDGAIRTACQQACPTRAIVFGTLSDEGAQVTERHARARRYDVLHELGTRPRVAYLLRIRNPNPELA